MAIKKYLMSLIIFCFSCSVLAKTVLNHMKMTALPNHPHTYALILTFTKPVTPKTFTLSNPNRLIMDFDDTQFNKNTAVPKWTASPIQNFHHGIQQGLNLRLVFTLMPQVTYSYTTVDNHHDFEIILMLSTPDLPIKVAAEEQTPTKKAAAIKVMHPENPTKEIDRSEVDTSANDKIAALVTDRISNLTKINLPSITEVNKPFVVVIDAGHGGKDPGTIGADGVQEKNVTLAIARDLQQLVQATPDMHAMMTRRGDYYVGLRQRLTLARQAHGDVFVAIHADAYNSADANGAAVFALSAHGASSESALWLAKRENYSELGGLDLNIAAHADNQLRSILINLSQTAATTASLQLGKDVLQQLQQVTDLHYQTVQQAPFMVLKSPDIPSILIETGFLSNPVEETRLNSEAYQKQLAQAIFAGIKNYDVRYASRNMRLVRMRAVG